MENFNMPKCRRLFHQRTGSIFLCVVFSLFTSVACTKSQPTGANVNPTSSPTTATETSTTTTTTTTVQQGASPTPSVSPQSAGNAQSNTADSKTDLPPPTLAEAQASVARIYKNAVTLETGSRGSAPFIVGDFNDDGSQDIAVVVKPARGMLPTLNNELANWIVEDVTKVTLPVEHNGVAVLPPKPEPVKIEPDDQLLVVIHGYQKDGWRNAEAQQTYLLKNAVGENMRAQSIKYALAGMSGKNPHVTVGGDVIKETRANQAGFIYWTGAKYAWRQ